MTHDGVTVMGIWFWDSACSWSWSALADVLHIGGEPGCGCRQGTGGAVGLALIIAGLWWKHRR